MIEKLFIFFYSCAFIWLGRQITATIITDRWTNRLWFTQEMHVAVNTAGHWMLEGKIKTMNMGQTMDHLTRVCRGDLDKLRLLSNPHGYTVYRALLTKRHWYNFH